MTYPEIRIKLGAPMPESIKAILREKKELRIARIAAAIANPSKVNSSNVSTSKDKR